MNGLDDPSDGLVRWTLATMLVVALLCLAAALQP